VGDGGVLGFKREKGVCELGGRWERGKGKEGEWEERGWRKFPLVRIRHGKDIRNTRQK